MGAVAHEDPASTATPGVSAESISLSSFDPGTLDHVVQGAHFEHRRLPGGSTGMRLLHCKLAKCTLDRGDYMPAVLVNGNFGRNAMTLGTTLRSRLPTLLNAMPVDAGNVQVYGEGAELCYRAWPECTWFALAIPRERLEQYILDRFDELPSLPRAGLVNFRPSSDEAARQLASELTDLTDSLRGLGRVATNGNRTVRNADTRLAESVETDIIGRMVGIIMGRPRTGSSDDRAGRRRCREMLSDAMTQVSEDPDDCLDVFSLSRSTNMSPRSVQRHFQAICGLCPQEWFRIERLNRAHEELCEGRPGATVTRVAMRWGFFHLGRFSRYYRDVFGENPVQTLRNASPICARAGAIGREAQDLNL